MDREAWRATVHGVAKSWTQLIDWTEMNWVFFSKSVLLIRWPKYWSLSFSISPSIEYSGLISFRIDWFDLLAVQGTLRKNYVAVQSLSQVQLLVTPWTAAPQPSLSITNSWSLLKLMSIVSVMPSNCLILCRPLLLLPSIFPASGSSNKSVLCIRWPNYWSFSFSTSPSNEYSGLISPTIDWFDLPAVQGTLKSLLQHHNSKGSILWHSAFVMVQFSHLYMITRKTRPL